VTIEENDANGQRVLDTTGLSALSDSMLELSVRAEGEVHRHLAIRKSRVSRYDLRVRELVLGDAGFVVAEPVIPAGA